MFLLKCSLKGKNKHDILSLQSKQEALLMYKDPFENLVSLEQAAVLWNMEVNEIVKLAESEKINAKKFDNVWIIDKRKERKNLQRNHECWFEIKFD